VDNPLQAVSNVIELEPGHKYLLVFKDTNYTPNQLEALAYQLDRMGYQCLAVGIYDDKADVQVIEVPNGE
jgi:hypothetical protein